MWFRIVTGSFVFAIAAVLGIAISSKSVADAGIDVEFFGRIGVESQSFLQHGDHPNQRRRSYGVILEPEFYFETPAGSSFSLRPFYRYDSADERRRHGDLREAYFLWFGEAGNGEWELRLGIEQIFWGVTETTNIVNIINQSDLVEDLTEKEKLGQPMAHLTWSADWGVTEFFVLPYHRKRTYPGENGRFRSPLVVDNSEASYENSKGKRHIDYALRYSHNIGLIDFGISGFSGTSRTPFLRPDISKPTPKLQPSKLLPYYGQIRQIGLDLQVTLEYWLLKLEAIRRKGARNSSGVEEDYNAYIAGAERTFYSVFGSNTDITALGEWVYDSRGPRSTESLDDDAFLGIRWALNDTQDTEFVVGYVADSRYESATLSAEFNRRISDEYSLEVELFSVDRADVRDLNFYPINKDSNLSIRLYYHF
ncbi:MAG: hypothetical protein OXI60_05935 [Acidiferrobacterales bacterium]|nr:hypothetical protein [Acidiferrobacterales bacterium]